VPAVLLSFEAGYSIVQVTDIHLDLFNRTCTKCANSSTCLLQGQWSDFGLYGCDATIALVNASLAAAANENPRYVIFTGDSAAHHALDFETVETEMMKIGELSRHFIVDRDIPFFAMLGNDDFFDDYNATCYSDSYKVMAAAFPHSLSCTKCERDITPDELANNQDTVIKGGYYTVKPTESLRIIVMNTVLYTPDASTSLDNDPCGQQSWLESVLQQAKQNNERVVLAGHIPPGQTVWEYAHRQQLQNILHNAQLWQVPRTNAFTEALAPYWSDTIAVAMFGHTHRDAFRLLSSPGSSSSDGAVMVSPSVSPIYFNNPGIRKYYFGGANHVAFEVSMLYTTLNNLRTSFEGLVGSAYTEAMEDMKFELEYNFKDAYSAPASASFPTTIFQSVAEAIERDDRLFWTWLAYHSALYDATKIEYLCMLTKPLQDGFDSCTGGL